VKSTCTNFARRPARGRRGLADIELILVIIVLLIPLFLLMATASTLGRNVITTAYSAENEAYAQAVSENGQQASTDPVPPVGIIDVRPDLPNRLLYAAPANSVTLDYGKAGQSAFTYSEKAAFLGPSWHLNGADHEALAEWFDDYVAEDHPPALVQSLGLQPAGPP
jgi:hypothetical protein